MELSYEEVMQRIEQYEKEDMINYKCCRKYCREKKYPWDVDLYKGENQIIVVPLITSIGWFSVDMAWYHQITDIQNAQLIGKTVLDAVEHIRFSPVDARTKAERDEDSFIMHATTCKSYKSFNRKYLLCGFHLYEDGGMIVSQTHRLKVNNGYGGTDSLINLFASATACDIGCAVIKSFNDMELLNDSLNKIKCPILSTEFETVSGKKISFEAPQDDNYTDEQDYHSAEIYQGYSYSKGNADEPVADMYFGIAPELDCDISPENVQKSYDEQYGKAESFKYEPIKHPIFDFCAEMINSEIHQVIYLKKVDEFEVLSCELILKIKPAGKRLYLKIIKDFESLIKSCK